MPVSVSLLLENSVTALLVIAYLFYEIRWGRVANWQERLDGMVDAILAIAREHENIDEDAVSDRLNGESPRDFVHRYSDYESSYNRYEEDS